MNALQLSYHINFNLKCLIGPGDGDCLGILVSGEV